MRNKDSIWKAFLTSKGLDPSGDEPLPAGMQPREFYEEWEDHLMSHRTGMPDGTYRIDGMDHWFLNKGGVVQWINGPSKLGPLGNPQPADLPVGGVVELLGIERVGPDNPADFAGYVSSQKQVASGAGARTAMPDGAYRINGMDHWFLVKGGHVQWINGESQYRALGSPPVKDLPVGGIVDLLGIDRVAPDNPADFANYKSSQEKARGQAFPGMPTTGWRAPRMR